MSASIDMSLDDIIKARRTTRNPRGGSGSGRQGGVGGGQRQAARNVSGGGRSNVPRSSQRSDGIQRARGHGNASAAPSGAWMHDLFQDARGGSGIALDHGTRVLVSNLHFEVSERDLWELFGRSGTIKSVKMNYDRAGRSLGSAEVTFQRKSDAVKSLEYNSLALDGRKLNVELISRPVEISQVDSRPSAPRQNLSGFRAIPNSRSNNNYGGNNNGSNNSRARGRRGPGRRGPRRNDGPAPSKEDLDKQLDAYRAGSSMEVA